MTTSETNDQAALKLHYANKYPISSKTIEESFSMNKLQANININRTILPFYR